MNRRLVPLLAALAAALLCPAPSLAAVEVSKSGTTVTVTGEAFQDRIVLAGGPFQLDEVEGDAVDAGAGCSEVDADTVVCDGQVDRVVVHLNGGDDFVTGSTNPGRLPLYAKEVNGSDGNDTLGPLAGSDTLNGGDAGDTFDGGPGNDIVKGNAGVHVAAGGDGDDVLTGGPDADTLRGQGGSDVVDGDGGDDVLDERLEGGVDVLDGGVGGDSLFGGGSADQLVGGAYADTITGGDDANLLEGGAGGDTLGGRGVVSSGGQQRHRGGGQPRVGEGRRDRGGGGRRALAVLVPVVRQAGGVRGCHRPPRPAGPLLEPGGQGTRSRG